MPTAVIDLGSNSARLLVADIDESGHVAVLADARSALRLLRRLDQGGNLPEAAIAATIQTIAGLAAIARNSGAKTVTAVATAALREAKNAAQVVAAVKKETGIALRIIDGDEEARLATRGAIHGLPVNAGLSLDIGGGSLEVANFTRTKQGPTWSMPLGALRLTDMFFHTDPPKKSSIAELRDHAQQVLRLAALPPELSPRDCVGTGGTIRAVAKIARNRKPSLVRGVHGYRLTQDDVCEVADLLTGKPQSDIVAMSGVNADRAVSILAGVNVLRETLDHLAITELLVSGKGLRDGLALTLVDAPSPSTSQVRECSVRYLATQFAGHSEPRAAWRVEISLALLRALDEHVSADVEATLRDAALLLDIGRSIDFYDKHAHTIDIVVTADLPGFSQRDRAVLAGTINRAGDPGSSLRNYKPVLSSDDLEVVEKAGLILALADGMEPRTHADSDLLIRREEGQGRIQISVPLAAPWRPLGLIRNVRKVFGKELVIAGDGERDVSIDVR